ncbi:BQ2448_2616 [Microbotryum intermedium]|uniref:BQ2448_2616 protein n=1 Tax=Microbotryum intermedium TaxID=269621 RepID=A0A238FEU2_9BASI|nr:BQ2448_2616 [Microbotryum intermedium]
MYAIRRAIIGTKIPGLTRQLSTATSTSSASTVLQRWIDSAPSNVLHLEDHVTLSRVQSLVSTIEVPQDGLASQWSSKGDILPAGWTLLFFPPWDSTTSSLGLDGTEKTPHHPPLEGGLDERMWVGGSFTFPRNYQTPNSGQGIRIGHGIQCTAKVVDVKKKIGKDGRTGYYVQVEREIREQGTGDDGSSGTADVAVKETRIHIYRPSMTDEQRKKTLEASASQSLKKLEARRNEADFVMEFLPTPNMLMRFSALTFNTHRIHWDERYCKEIEGREGLIVHGPLTALLLLNTFRHHLPQGVEGVKDFTYRNTAPLVVDRKVAFCGKWKGDECELWVEQEDGLVVMTAVGRGWKKEE